MTTRKFIRQVVTIYVIIPALVVLALLYVASRAVAHHDPSHRVLVIGEQTKVIIRIQACDTLEQAKEITDVGKEGLEAFHAILSIYSQRPNEDGEPICGMLTDIIVPTQVLYTVQISKYTVTVFSFMDSEGMTYYGFTPLPVIQSGREAKYTGPPLRGPFFFATI